ncbi:MAG: iron-containing alcohol dehydrogenase [Melioribacteraceae bacterium]|nr:iron-containing alcohol dehydrogenase [Melioribacteraceae bacterium]
MKKISINFPRKLVFGNDCLGDFLEEIRSLDFRKILLVADRNIEPTIEKIRTNLSDAGIEIKIDTSITKEPNLEDFNTLLKFAEDFNADCVIGLGGGSVLDAAKLAAALQDSAQDIQDVFGIGQLKERNTPLVCLPTTSGTGSEVSPNAILLDENDNMKKGVISPHLMPDMTFVDPILTLSVPPQVTAATGIDALTHCIEAFANKNSHPIIDQYAIKGIELIAKELSKAVKNGNDADAREKVSLGSMYGGICLGPVNTAAVHALSYPLGGTFHIAHGISNAVLLPYVMKFNAEEVPGPYAEIARTIGAPIGKDDYETAMDGIKIIENIYEECSIPKSLRELNIPEGSIERMADSALGVTRLLKNNLRELSREDAVRIYEEAY